METKVQAARYLPNTTWNVDTGSVIKSSMVPLFLSSAHIRMATAGIRNR